MTSALQDLLAKKRAQESSPARSEPSLETPGQEGTSAPSLVTSPHGDDDNPKPASEPDDKGTPAAATGDEPYGVAQVVTPSGIEIYFQAGPKRLYRLRKLEQAAGLDISSDWLEVPSMSDVKDVLDKAGLPWWGMGVGVEGVMELFDRGVLHQYGNVLGHAEVLVSKDDIVRLLTQYKLTVNHQRDKAGDRGTNVHKALEVWAEKGVRVAADVYPAHERGYVQGVMDFLVESGASPVVSEVMVGSLEWGFAGRFDLIAEIPDGAEVYVHRTEKGRGDRTEKIDGGRWLLDLKTSKDVYASHQLQCAGYELAYQECYGEKTDHQGVIQVSEDGRYKLVKSRATIAHFQNLKCLYDSLKEIG